MPDLTQFSTASLFVMLVTLSVCVAMVGAFLIMRQIDRVLDKPEPVKVKRKRKARTPKADHGDPAPSYQQGANTSGAAKTSTAIPRRRAQHEGEHSSDAE